MNPRHRYKRRKAGRTFNSQKKKRILSALGLSFGLTLVMLLIFVVHNALGKSDFFQITDINISGCKKVSKREVLEYSGVDIHSNLFLLDIDEVRANVEAGQWIMQAKIDKHWPNRLDISVTEYTPVAMVNLESGLFYVDGKGTVFAEVLLPGDFDYPVLTGFQATLPGNLSKDKTLGNVLTFIKYASRGNLNLPAQNISEINVHDPGNAILFLVDRPFPIYLGSVEKSIKTKYSRLARILSWLYRKKKFSSTEYIKIDYSADKCLVGLKTL